MPEDSTHDDFWNALALAAIVLCMALWQHV